MALLDTLLGQVLGQQNQPGSAPGGIAGTLMQLLSGQGGQQGGYPQGGYPQGNNPQGGYQEGPQGDFQGGYQGGGGLAGLIDQFRSSGLGHIAESWVGTGQNHPVSPQQLHQVFGDEQVQSMAQQAGMGQQDFLSQLSQHLPRMVDGMTPGGRMPDEGTVSV